MEFRALGTSGVSVSVISFGAGPVPALMTDGGRGEGHRETVRRAVEAGINWFDTAATYGDGASERSLGAALKDVGARAVHVATKVRLAPDQLDRIAEAVKASLRDSLRRLQMERVTLLQLHNAVTRGRGDEPTSITPSDVLGPGGVLDAFRDLKRDGHVAHVGLTGLGHSDALREVIRSGEFETIQICYNILNPSADHRGHAGSDGEDYGGIMRDCAEKGMGIIAIRVLAGGALAGLPPSAHTLKTRFFPLAIYERDAQRAKALSERLPPGTGLKEAAVRFALSHPAVSTALIGFSNAEQIDEAIRFASRGPLPGDLLERLRSHS